MQNQKFTTHSPEETKEIARKLSRELKEGDVLGLRGDLGSGKTTFVQGLMEGLGKLDDQVVSSPTFTLINEYSSKKGPVYHMDFYRMASEREADSLGLDQYFNGKGISVIEWFEKSAASLPKDFLEIQFQHVDGDNTSSRKIVFIPQTKTVPQW